MCENEVRGASRKGGQRALRTMPCLALRVLAPTRSARLGLAPPLHLLFRTARSILLVRQRTALQARRGLRSAPSVPMRKGAVPERCLPCAPSRSACAGGAAKPAGHAAGPGCAAIWNPGPGRAAWLLRRQCTEQPFTLQCPSRLIARTHHVRSLVPSVQQNAVPGCQRRRLSPNASVAVAFQQMCPIAEGLSPTPLQQYRQPSEYAACRLQ